jgi:hypothetical protein
LEAAPERLRPGPAGKALPSTAVQRDGDVPRRHRFRPSLERNQAGGQDDVKWQLARLAWRELQEFPRENNERVQPICECYEGCSCLAASARPEGRFETAWLTRPENLTFSPICLAGGSTKCTCGDAEVATCSITRTLLATR